jgi:polysaccharide export outer membrane protein
MSESESTRAIRSGWVEREPIVKIMRTHFAMRPNNATRDRISGRMKLMLCVSAIALVLGGCSARDADSRGESGDKDFASKPMTAEQCAANASIQESAAQDTDYRIQSGDILSLDFYMNPEFNDKNVKVDPNGKIVLRMVGPLQAAGRTPDQLASSIDKAYINELRNPGAVVHVNTTPNRQIFVEGEVAKPGAFPLQPGMTAVEALALAGGVTTDSAPNDTVLIRRDACGQAQGSKVDLASALKKPGSSEDVALAPHDVMVVPRSGIANFDLWMKQHVRDALPVEPYLSPTF